MNQWKHIVLTIFFAVYIATVLLTDISLIGFWTDILFSIVLSTIMLIFVFKRRANKLWLTISLKIVNVLCLLTVFGLLILHLVSSFFWDILKLRTFYYQPVDGRLFNAYFKPVGAYSGGYGNFWITETPKYFPLLESRVYFNRTVHHDFSDDTFDGNPIDNYEVVHSYIKEEIIDKQKLK